MRKRRIVSVDRTCVPFDIHVIPRACDWSRELASFDLLGTTRATGIPSQHQMPVHQTIAAGAWNPIPIVPGTPMREAAAMSGHCVCTKSQDTPLADDPSDTAVREKLRQLVRVLGSVVDCPALDGEEDYAWLGRRVIHRLSSIAEVFALLEQQGTMPFSEVSLWEHSLRAGNLAGHIAKAEQASEAVVIQSCLAGLFHDVGLAILAAAFEPTRYGLVIQRAQERGMTLSAAELLEFGVSHDIVGAEFLQRRQVPEPIVQAVAFHDEPARVPRSAMTPTIAVYAANLLDGGGWPQDSDGVPSDRALGYLADRGFGDSWPRWQRCVEKLAS